MMRTYTIELLKKVPIAETDEAKWLVDTGCPFSYQITEQVSRGHPSRWNSATKRKTQCSKWRCRGESKRKRRRTGNANKLRY